MREKSKQKRHSQLLLHTPYFLMPLYLFALLCPFCQTQPFTHSLKEPTSKLALLKHCLVFLDTDEQICQQCQKGFYLPHPNPSHPPSSSPQSNYCLKCPENCANQDCNVSSPCVIKSQQEQHEAISFDYLHLFASRREVELTISRNQLEKSPSESRFLLSDQNCTDSQYLSQLGSCVQCSLNCKTCINSSQQCTSCQDTQILIDKTCLVQCPIAQFAFGKNCLASCPSTYYGDGFTHQCLKCPDSCAECLNSSTCTSCKSGTYLENGDCTAICSTTSFASQGLCTECPSSCTTCSSLNLCISCQQGYYLTLQKNCELCHSSCSSCSGPSPKDCLTCADGLNLSSEKSCKSNNSVMNKPTCATNQYLVVNGNSANTTTSTNTSQQLTCLSCHPSCLSCSGPTKQECTSCDITIPLYFSSFSQCLESCPTHTYLDISQNACAQCDANCLECTEKSKCKSCYAGYFLEKTILQCKQCHNNCRYCTGPTADQCMPCNQSISNSSSTSNVGNTNSLSQSSQLCSTNYCRYGLFEENSSCFELSDIRTCKSASTFLDYSKRVCQPCDATCQYCSSSTVCTQCINDQYLLSKTSVCVKCQSAILNCFRCASSSICVQCNPGYELSSTGTCVYACQTAADGSTLQQYFFDQSTSTCSACPQGCQSCSQLISAKITRLTCSSCLDGYYLDISQMACIICQSGCLLCDGPKTCFKCSDSYFLQTANSQFTEQLCTQSCKQGFYPEIISRQCISCDFNNCSQCTSSSVCTTCIDGYYLQKIDNTCQLCDQTCKTCNGNASNCSSCYKDKYLKANASGSKSCVVSCDKSEYLFESTCLSCSLKCEFCISETFCQGCVDGYYLVLGDSVLNSKCQSCPAECQSCSDPLNCTACNASYYLHKGKCIPDCQLIPRYFSNTQTNTCTQCHPLCQKCISSSLQDCQVCIDGYFKDNSLNACSKCNSNCAACVDSSDNCTNCYDNTFLLQSNNQITGNQLASGKSSCITTDQSCGKGYFHDYQSLSCKQCVPPCIECQGETIYECNSCIDGYYFQQENPIKCNQCAQNCLKCHTDTNSNSASNTKQVCDLCTDGYILDSTTLSCVPCGNNQYSFQNNCLPCHASCSSCVSSANTDCAGCFSNHFLKPTNNQLSIISPISGQCLDCYIGCNTCFAADNKSCLSCSKGFYFFMNQCFADKCPFGLTADSNATCNCQIDGCSKCELDPITYSSICTSCSNSSYFLHKSTCIPVCPDPFLEDTDHRRCVDKCDETQYYLPDLQECSASCFFFTLFASQGTTQMPSQIHSSKLCLSKCPSGYYYNQGKRICYPCHEYCLDCFGPSNYQCSPPQPSSTPTSQSGSFCSLNAFFHEGTHSCLERCAEGYILSDELNIPKICKLCRKGCFSCGGGLLLFSTDCVETCPAGYKTSDMKRCILDKNLIMEILNKNELAYDYIPKITRTISDEVEVLVSSSSDIVLECVVLNLSSDQSISKVYWQIQHSSDSSILAMFERGGIVNNQQALVIGARSIRGGTKLRLICKVEIASSKSEKVYLVKKVNINILEELDSGKLAVDINTIAAEESITQSQGVFAVTIYNNQDNQQQEQKEQENGLKPRDTKLSFYFTVSCEMIQKISSNNRAIPVMTDRFIIKQIILKEFPQETQDLSQNQSQTQNNENSDKGVFSGSIQVNFPLNNQPYSMICSGQLQKVVYQEQLLFQDEDSGQTSQDTHKIIILSSESQYLFSEVKIESSADNMSSIEKYLIKLLDKTGQLTLEEYSVILSSATQQAKQIALSRNYIAQVVMEAVIKEASQSLNDNQTTNFFTKLFSNCSANPADNSSTFYCTCDTTKYAGIYCQYSTNDHKLLLQTTSKTVAFIEDTINSQIIPSYKDSANNQYPSHSQSQLLLLQLIPLIKNTLNLQTQFSGEVTFIELILFKYLPILRQAISISQINEYQQDILELMGQLYVSLSSLTISQDTDQTKKKDLISEFKKEETLQNAKLALTHNIGDTTTIIGTYFSINAVSFQASIDRADKLQQQRQQEYNQPEYITVSYNGINIEIPPQIAYEKPGLTVIQKQTLFLLQNGEIPSNNPQAGTTQPSPKTILVSSIYDIDFYSKYSGEKLEISDLVQPLRFGMQLFTPLNTTTAESFIAGLECVTFDYDSYSWTTHGIHKVGFQEENYQIICETTHLSTFAVRIKPGVVPIDSQYILDINKLSAQNKTITEDIITLDDYIQPNQKSIPILKRIQSTLAKQMNYFNPSATKTPYFIDSLVEIATKERTILHHFTFEGITPFRYPPNFIEPFGFVIVLCLMISMGSFVGLTKFNVVFRISERIRKLKDNRNARKLARKDQAAQQSGNLNDPGKGNSNDKGINNLLDQGNQQENQNNYKKKSRLNDDKIGGTEGNGGKKQQEVKTSGWRIKKDINFFKKIRDNIHLMYEQDNLETPKNQDTAAAGGGAGGLTPGLFSEALEQRKVEENQRKQKEANDEQAKQTNQDQVVIDLDDDMTFGSVVAKVQSNNNKLLAVQKNNNNNNNSPSFLKQMILSPISESRFKRSGTRQSSIMSPSTNKEKVAAGYIWEETDFIMEIKAKKSLQERASLYEQQRKSSVFHPNSKNPMKKRFSMLAGDAIQSTKVLVKNPLNHLKWYMHSSVMSMLFSNQPSTVGKCLCIVYCHLVLFAIGVSAILSSRESAFLSILISTFVAPLVVQLLFSVYNLAFYAASQLSKYNTIRTYSTQFHQILQTRFIQGYLLLAFLVLVPSIVMLTYFGQRQYIANTKEVVVRFITASLIDLAFSEALSLILAYFMAKNQQKQDQSKKLSQFVYSSFFIAKGSAVHFSDISYFYLQKSQKDKKENKQIQDIEFKGDVQNEHRKIISSKTSTPKNKKPAEGINLKVK